MMEFLRIVTISMELIITPIINLPLLKLFSIKKTNGLYRLHWNGWPPSHMLWMDIFTGKKIIIE